MKRLGMDGRRNIFEGWGKNEGFKPETFELFQRAKKVGQSLESSPRGTRPSGILSIWNMNSFPRDFIFQNATSFSRQFERKIVFVCPEKKSFFIKIEPFLFIFSRYSDKVTLNSKLPVNSRVSSFDQGLKQRGDKHLSGQKFPLTGLGHDHL